MKIAIFSKTDQTGGAAKASYRLYLGLKKLDCSLNYFVKNKILKDKKIIKLKTENYLHKQIEKTIHKNYISQNRTSLTNTFYSFSYASSKLPNLENFDIINLHWTEYFLSLKNLLEIVKLNKPIVLTLHDMKFFTGGCHYSNSCEEYKKDCLNCKQLKNDEKKLAHIILTTKRNIFKRQNITVISPSSWLAKEAKKSSLFKQTPIYVIPNGIDSNKFKAINKKDAKKYFNIPSNSIVLSSGVMDHGEQRKGFNYLLKILELLKKRKLKKEIYFLLFGKNSEKDFPIKTINIGFIDNEEKLSYAYSASDIFLLPSIEDNLPNTMLESLSCQTPIVAFDTGGVKDVIDDSCGRVIEQKNISSFEKEVFNLIINNKLRKKLGKNGRNKILKNFQIFHQANRYLNLFKNLEKKEKNIQVLDKKILTPFNNLVGSLLENTQYNNNLNFNIEYSKFFDKITKLQKTQEKYILYGNGSISKTIQKLIPEKIITYVDINDENNHPLKLQTLQYDKILITVLGREKEIIKYLIKNLNIKKDKIIKLI